MDGTSDVAVFILAGGKSTRMGTDKAFVTLDGRTMLARVLEVARSVADDVHIVGDAAKYAPFAPIVEDVFRNCGPLGGIHAALRSSQAELNLILAIDAPFVLPAFLRYLISRARSVPSALATAAHTNEGWQPLCAVYRCEFAELAENALRAGQYKIGTLFDEANTQAISENELKSNGFSLRVFRNLNTPEELSQSDGT